MPAPFKLPAQRRAEFDQAGVLRLPGFLPADAAGVMADAIWGELSRRLGARKDRPDTWSETRPAHFQALVASGAFDAFGSPDVVALADALMGKGAWTRGWRGGLPLVTFPTGDWDVPHQHWHFDLPTVCEITDIAAIRLFTFLEPVRARGGGTLFVAGSHRVIGECARRLGPGIRLKSSDARALARRAAPWFDAPCSPGGGDRVDRFMVEGARVEGVQVRVEEMSGEPGDLLVMHPAVFHAGAPNGLDQPRLMLTQTLARS